MEYFGRSIRLIYEEGQFRVFARNYNFLKFGDFAIIKT